MEYKMVSKFTGKCSENSNSTKVFLSTFDSPVGKIKSAADDNFLYIVLFEDSKAFEKKLQWLAEEINCTYADGTNEILKTFESELRQYFDGKITKFSVPLKTFGSVFQEEVWRKLLEIPYGTTCTYGNFAKVLRKPAGYARAIGSACGANAHVLVIPCHRLVASYSKGGYSSGVDRKEWLLEHEKKMGNAVKSNLSLL